MINGLIGKKVGMTQVYNEEGQVIPVTVVQAGPCVVTQVKSEQNDGYVAVQIGLIESMTPRGLTKPEAGHLSKNNLAPMRHLSEFRVVGETPAVGDQILASSFKTKDIVNVSGISQGKGFQGVIKRHGFGGGRATHGSHFKRAPGSIGQCATPSRVFPGKKMPGHMGARKVTTTNLEVVQIIEDKNLLLIKGAIPGHKGGVVVIRKR